MSVNSVARFQSIKQYGRTSDTSHWGKAVQLLPLWRDLLQMAAFKVSSPFPPRKGLTAVAAAARVLRDPEN